MVCTRGHVHPCWLSMSTPAENSSMEERSWRSGALYSYSLFELSLLTSLPDYSLSLTLSHTRTHYSSLSLSLLHTCPTPMQLGAGTAVPGMVAAKCEACVTLSDYEGNPRLLSNLKRSCELNGLTVGSGENDVKILPLSWGVFSPTFIKLEPPDIILASDCFYDTKGQLKASTAHN